jgi:dihydrofolate reductase
MPQPDSSIRLSLVVAMSRNRVIGKSNQLPWRMSDDLKRFKTLTMDHVVIMGRRTFESMNSKPLPGRTNIVITRRTDFHPNGIIIAHDLEEAVRQAELHDGQLHRKGEAFIIGGAEIFQQALSRADRIHLTLIDAQVEGDTFFPPIDASNWNLTFEELHKADDRNDHDCRFRVHERVTKLD